MGKFSLDVDRALHSRQRAAERGKNAVPRGAANSSIVLGDETIGDQAKSGQGRQRSFLVDLHQPAIARDIGGKNGDELSLEGRGFHLVILLARPGDRPS